MTDFEQFGLTESILHTLKHMNYTTPTPIQEKTIPLALEGKDILGSAQTGTGKTAAFAIPLAYQLQTQTDINALILLPTRELADQVNQVVCSILGKSSKIKTALLIGGASMQPQITKLRANPRIIIGTPGRINDHLTRKTLKLDKTKIFILDEMDRMLDMGFGAQLKQIKALLPEERQTLMFSATLPLKIVAAAKEYMTNYERIAIGSTTAVANNVKQQNIKVDDANKYTILMEQLHTYSGSSLIFVKTKYGTERLAKKLVKEGMTANALHGDLKQNQRTRVIESFRQNKIQILVATDIAARGLDIHHIEKVINYDLPQCPEDYIHRIGRTARAGEKGTAINLLSSKDGEKWAAICQLLDSVPPSIADEENAKVKKPKKHPKISILQRAKHRGAMMEHILLPEKEKEKEATAPKKKERHFKADKNTGSAKKERHFNADKNIVSPKNVSEKSRGRSFKDSVQKTTESPAHKKKRSSKPFTFNRFKKSK